MVLFESFQLHIQKSFSFLKGKNLLIAISGGLDSIVLTHLLYQLNYTFSLAHCNFKLRGLDSDKDENFVKNEAQKMNIPFFVTAFDTEKFSQENGISIQMAARDLRYNWFKELIQEHRFDYLLTAHHADDNLETFLINFTRGTGLDGLTGIPAINNNIIRPLLLFSRKEIELYAKENQLKWREDKSNLNTKYLRNKIRHDLVPILKELNPGFLKSFSKTIQNLQGGKQIISDRMDNLKDEIAVSEGNLLLKLPVIKLKSLNNPKAYLYELLNSYGFTEWDDVLSLLHAQSGKQILSQSHRLIKDREFLLLSKLFKPPLGVQNIEIQENTNKIDLAPNSLYLECLKYTNIENNKSFELYQDQKIKTVIFVDYNKLKFPLTVRKWVKGDYFYPLGMNGKKKLSKFFKDEKLSLLEKENIWLLCSEENIIWVIGKRMDNRYKINDVTKKVIKFKFK